MNLEQQLEALLFYKAEETTLQELSKLCERSEDEVRSALETLQESLSGRGVTLVWHENRVTLGTHPEAAELIKKLKEEELSKNLGKAGLETLALVLYRSPISKSQIDYIRGVNAGTILRNLQVRGLVEKYQDPQNSRRVLYKPTLDALKHLGVTNVESLPESADIQEGIDAFEATVDQAQNS